MMMLAILPQGVFSFIAAIAVFCLLWYAVGFIPEPFAKLRWVGYILLLLIVAYYIWTRFVHHI